MSDAQADALKIYLREHDFKTVEVPYARFAGSKPYLNVVFYESGKLVLQGKGTQEFIEFTLEPEILKEAKLGYEAVLNPDLLLPRLGLDGVFAAVYGAGRQSYTKPDLSTVQFATVYRAALQGA